MASSRTHMVLSTDDMQERRLAYDDIAPYVWWHKAYGRGSVMPATVLGTHAQGGWPMHTIDVPAVVLDEFIKILRGVTTAAQAWKATPALLDKRGYSLAEWRRCLVRYELADASTDKRKREDDGDAEPVVAKKVRGKAPPQLNPMEEKIHALGCALGAYARDNHPDIAAFLAGDIPRLEMQFLGDLKRDGAPADDTGAFQIEVPGFGLLPLVKTCPVDSAPGYRASYDIMSSAVGSMIHPRACGQFYDCVGHLGGSPVLVMHWPAVNDAPGPLPIGRHLLAVYIAYKEAEIPGRRAFKRY